MDAQKLTEAAFAASGATSIRAFAELVGVSHVSVLAWLDGSRIPSFEHAATLAKLAGLPIIKTASEVRMAAPENARHKSILKHLAATATLLAVVVFSALPRPAQASDFGFQSPTVDIMRNTRWDHLRRHGRSPAHSGSAPCLFAP